MDDSKIWKSLYGVSIAEAHSNHTFMYKQTINIHILSRDTLDIFENLN